MPQDRAGGMNDPGNKLGGPMAELQQMARRETGYKERLNSGTYSLVSSKINGRFSSGEAVSLAGWVLVSVLVKVAVP